MKTKIDLQKQRQIGEIVQDTFAFIRQEFKPLLTSLLRLAGPAMVLILVVFAFFIYSFGDLFSSTSYEANVDDSAIALLAISYLAIIALSLVVNTLTQGTILHYIRLYQEKGQTPSFDPLRASVWSSFWPILGLTLLVGLVLVVGFMLCLLPGIYLMVPLLLSFPLLVFRQMGVGAAFSAGFSLIRGNWWRVFGAFLLVYIILVVASSIMFIPSYIYQIAVMMTVDNIGDMQSAVFQDPIYILLNIVSVAIQYLLSMVLPIALCLLYFDLDERQRGTGALNRIGALGGGGDAPSPISR